MKTINSILTGLLLVPFMVGCVGGDSDALKDYKNIKAEAPTGKKPTTQNAASPDPEHYFSLHVVGPDDVNFVNIDQGKPANIPLKVTVNHPGITQYDVQLVPPTKPEDPIMEGATLQNNGNGNYSLKWTPPLGTVPRNTDSVQFKAQIQVSPQSQDENLSKIANNFTVVVEVKNSVYQPTVESTSKLDSIQEGVPSHLEVIVNDPATALYPASAPEVVITSYPYNNKEAYRADGRPYVFQDSVERESANSTKWKFNLTMYAQSLPLGKDREGHDVPSSETVPVCFYIRALGASERMSGAKEICMTGKYAAQPPVITYNPAPPAEVKAGVETSLSFQVTTANPSGKVSLRAPLKQIAALSGTHSIDCNYQDANKPNTMNCVIKWKPACVKAAVKNTLAITADSTLNDKVKSVTDSKEISVTPNTEACKAGGR